MDPSGLVRGPGHVHGMDNASKHKKRPCSICRRWFLPDLRVGCRQKTCSPTCKKALAAKRGAAWRRKNPDYEEHRRLVADLARAERVAIEIQPAGHPVARLPWRLVQTQLGGKMAVVLAVALRLQSRPHQTPFDVRIRVPTCVPVRLPRVLEQT